MAEREAIVLLGALAYGHDPGQHAAFRDDDLHRHAEAALKQAGILYDLVRLRRRCLWRRLARR